MFRSANVTYIDNTNALNANAPYGYQTNDILVAILTQDGSGDTLGFPSGWNQVRTDDVSNGDTQTVSWGWKVANGSDSFAFTGSGGDNMAVCIGAYSGIYTTSPIENSNYNNPNNVTVPTSPVSVTANSITTTNNGDDIIWLACVDTNGNDGIWTAPSDMTLRTYVPNNDNWNAVALADFNQSTAGATGSQVGTWTNSGSQGNFVAYLVILSPSSGVSTVKFFKMYSNGAIQANSFMQNSLPPNILMRLYASNNTLQANTIVQNGTGKIKLYANGQLSCNNTIVV